jgi:nucleolar protein 56
VHIGYKSFVVTPLQERSRPPLAHIVETLIGVFGVSEGGEIVERTLYPSDPKQIAAALERQSNGETTREVSETVDKLIQRGFKSFTFSGRALAETVRKAKGVKTSVESASSAAEAVRGDLERLAVEYGVAEDASHFHGLSREVSTLMAMRGVQKAQSERGAVIVQAVQLLNEVDKSLNVLSSKLREWYGLHFPEMGRRVPDHKEYARIVLAIGDRGGLDLKALEGIDVSERLAKALISAARDSMGASLAQDDIQPMRELASRILDLHDYRQKLEEYIAATARDVAPNLSELAGPVLAAKLIDKAGGLRRLAMMPSGTVQLLGAEKALFRSKKSGSRPPKHGLIFQHPYVHSRPKRLRGRASRKLASKLSLASRADFFSGRDLGRQLRKELDEEQA